MIRIGLTGPSGSGKGYISSLLAKRGVPTLDCDRVVHTLYQDESFVQVLSMAFGVDLSAPDGSVNRKRLGGDRLQRSGSHEKAGKSGLPSGAAKVLGVP